MSEQSNKDEQAGTDAGEGRYKRQGEDDVEGHRQTNKRDDGIPSDEGEGKRPHGHSEDDGPDVEGHRYARRS